MGVTDSAAGGDGLLTPRVCDESVGDTVGSRDDSEDDDVADDIAGEGERKRALSGGSVYSSLPDVSSGYSGLLLVAAIDADDDATDDAADAVRRAGRPMCGAPLPSLGSMGSGRLASGVEVEVDEGAFEGPALLRGTT